MGGGTEKEHERESLNSYCFDVKNDVTLKVLRTSTCYAPADFIFKIQSFSSLSGWTTKKVESSSFESGGYKWRLCISSRGSDKEDGGDISLYLSIVDTNKLPSGWEVLVNFKLFLFNQIKNEYLAVQDVDGKACRFHCLKTEWGYDKVLPLSTFTHLANGYVVDDSCAFGAEIFVIKPNNATFELRDLSKILESPDENIFTWKIKDYSHSKTTTILRSPEFIVGGRNWRLDFYPNGYGRELEKSISVFLTLTDSEALGNCEMNVNFAVRIRDQVSGGSKERQAITKFSSSKKSLGFWSLLSLTDLMDAGRQYLLDNTLVLEVEILRLSKGKEVKTYNVRRYCRWFYYYLCLWGVGYPYFSGMLKGHT